MEALTGGPARLAREDLSLACLDMRDSLVCIPRHFIFLKICTRCPLFDYKTIERTVSNVNK